MNVTEQYDKLSDRKDAICKNCGVPIQVNKRASVAKVLCDTCRKVKTTHNDSVKTNILKEVRYCQYCGGIIVNKNALIHCSDVCRRSAEWQNFCEAIEVSGGFNPKTTNYTRPKKYLKKVRGHKCEICGLTKWGDKDIPLILDHIDGNSDNWLLTNVRLVCPNCDALLPTYKGRNKNAWATKRARYRRSYYHKDRESI